FDLQLHAQGDLEVDAHHTAFSQGAFVATEAIPGSTWRLLRYARNDNTGCFTSLTMGCVGMVSILH
ncbi:MAG: hypothetical protein ACPL4H_09150, partial [Anaerolineales bacterium]